MSQVRPLLVTVHLYELRVLIVFEHVRPMSPWHHRLLSLYIADEVVLEVKSVGLFKLLIQLE